jgi:general secretion pathway protein C
LAQYARGRNAHATKAMTGIRTRVTFRRVALMALSVIGMTAVLAHSINAIVEHELAASPLPHSTQAAADVPSPIADGEAVQLAAFIKSSGLFALPTESPRAGEHDNPVQAARPSFTVAKKVRLIGLVLGDPAPAAVLEDIASKQQGLFLLNDEIPDVGVVRSIGREGVVIGHDDGEELLPLAGTAGDVGGTSPFLSDPPVDSLTTAGPPSKPFAPSQKRVLDRREIATVVSDPAQLMRQAHLVPFFTHDKLNGFRVDFVLPSGFFDKAGFQYGDVIQRVNGVEIRDPGKLLSFFSVLLSEHVVKVDVMRRNQPTTVTYELR